MNIDRTAAATLGTRTSMNIVYALLNAFLRNLGRRCGEITGFMTIGIAISKAGVLHTAEDNGCATSRTGRHGDPFESMSELVLRHA